MVFESPVETKVQVERSSNVGKIDRSKWESAGAAAADGDAGPASAQAVAEKPQADGEDGTAGATTAEAASTPAAAAAPAPRVIGKLDPSKLLFEAAASNATAGGGRSTGPVNVGKLDMSKFLAAKKYEPNTPQKATKASVGRLNMERLQIGDAADGDSSGNGAQAARTVGKLNVAGMAAFQNQPVADEPNRGPSRARNASSGSSSSAGGLHAAAPSSASTGSSGGGEATRSRAESLEVRATNAKGQLEKLRQLKATQKQSAGSTGAGSAGGVVPYSHGPLDTAGDGMVLLIWHPGLGGVVVARRDAVIASNKQICNGATIFCAGPI